MNRDQWEAQFTRQLKQKLGLTPEEIRFRWRGYYNQRFTVEGAIAHLIEVHRMCPESKILPEPVNDLEKSK